MQLEALTDYFWFLKPTKQKMPHFRKLFSDLISENKFISFRS